VEPDKVGRLRKTIRNHLGHRIAFAVEDAKIALSEQQAADIPLHFLEPQLHAPATQTGFERAIADKSRKLSQVAAQCVADAGLKPEDIQTVFLTGGSSRVPAVRKAIAKAAPNARVTSGSDMLSVASGLTREAARRFR
ncbi:MAG TPA: Hsp70 family protein, partial [Rhizomicrobium sp.]|nr:Hsp70 family protein [Rhizomicrobium sp.]